MNVTLEDGGSLSFRRNGYNNGYSGKGKGSTVSGEPLLSPLD
jgi:hypothetical protein